jgi:tRNA(Ile)-lysidine synthase
MPALLSHVRRFIRQHDLARSDSRVVCALSGGSDSVALAHILNELDSAGDLRLAGFVHLNHQLRAAAADDERFCRGLADALGKPIVVERADVGARARRERRSIEAAAHFARYESFDRARTALDADVVAVGHTRDDQAETFLLRLFRGAGPRGLAGMYPRNGSIVRPLLSCRRQELRDWLDVRRAQGDRFAAFVEDESNRDLTIPRNRLRAQVIPLLEGLNRDIVDVLAGEADLARELWTWLGAAADDLESLARADFVEVPASTRGPASGRVFQVEALRAAPPFIARTVLWRAMNDLAGGRPITFEHASAALELARGDRDSSVDLPGQRAQRIGPRLVLRSRHPANHANLFRYQLSIPGEVALPDIGCVVSADVGRADSFSTGGGAVVGNGPVAAVRGDLCREVLGVRNRRPGDRFRPVGLNGHKKLQDFFVDRKVARHTRDAVPIVVDRHDRIVWVAGYGIDEAFRVTDAAQAVLILKLTRA